MLTSQGHALPSCFVRDRDLIGRYDERNGNYMPALERHHPWLASEFRHDEPIVTMLTSQIEHVMPSYAVRDQDRISRYNEKSCETSLGTPGQVLGRQVKSWDARSSLGDGLEYRSPLDSVCRVWPRKE